MVVYGMMDDDDDGDDKLRILTIADMCATGALFLVDHMKTALKEQPTDVHSYITS